MSKCQVNTQRQEHKREQFEACTIKQKQTLLDQQGSWMVNEINQQTKKPLWQLEKTDEHAEPQTQSKTFMLCSFNFAKKTFMDNFHRHFTHTTFKLFDNGRLPACAC